MQSSLLHEDGKRTFALVFEEGEEALEGIEQFAGEQDLTAAHLTAIGAFSRATLGYYNREKTDSSPPGTCRSPVFARWLLLQRAGFLA